jgi:hypothetical protein
MKSKKPANDFEEQNSELTITIIPIIDDIWNKHIVSKISFLEHNILRLVSKKTNESTIEYYNCQHAKTSRHQTFWNILEKIEIMAAKKGYLNIIEWVYENLLWCIDKNIQSDNFRISSNIPNKILFTGHICQDATREGNLNVLKWFVNHGAERENEFLLMEAARGGHLDILEWLMEERELGFDNILDPQSVFQCGAMSGNLKVIKWLKEQDCDFRNCERYIAMSGNIEALKWMTKNYKKHEWNENMVTIRKNNMETKSEACIFNAAIKGHLHIIEFIINEGGSFNNIDKLYINAISGGHIHIVQWAIKKGYKCNYSILIEESAKKGHLDIIKILVETGEGKICSIDKFYSNAIYVGSIEIIQWGIENGYKYCFYDILKKSAKKGHLHIIKWLKKTHLKNIIGLDNKFRRNIGVIGLVSDKFNIFRWACKKEIFSQTREEGCINFIKTFKEINYKFSVRIINYICNDGSKDDLEILKWALKNDLKWDNNTCELPSYLGRLDILKFLIENGCPWDYCICATAVDQNRLDILQWAIDNGCSLWNFNNLLVKSKSENYINIYNYLLNIPESKRNNY